MSDYYLPRETSHLVDASLQRCQNLGLILDKYPTQIAIQKSEQKGNWLREIRPNSHIDERLAEQVYARWKQATESIHALHFDARTDWRMVVGLGGETVLETDLTLHHIYGIPFIPGSALKGLTRAYVASEVYKSDKIENDNTEMQRIFGTQKEAGSVIFFDAMPLDGQCTIELDIMNSHYPDYYGQQKPPTNDQSPNPVTFLTITNTTFTFALAPRRPDNPQHVKDVENVQGWLQKALRDYGVGGKTSAGYGSLTVVGQTANAQLAKTVEPFATPVDSEMSRVQGYIQELQGLRNSDVAGRINGFYQRWQQTQSDEARIALAKAIIEKVHQAGREKASAEKAWYRELREFLDKV
ncbi:MAG: hypothetical protein NVS4B7_21120 [Ktedonobacteraceae bacterium]